MEHKNKKAVVVLFALLILAQTVMFTAQSAPPPEPEIYETILESDKSVYVNEEQPTKNYNSGSNMYYLDIYQNEFMHNWVSLVEFDLSSLPEDAEVLDAEIRLYLIDAPSSSVTVKMYTITQNWYESSVTWNTKPYYYGLINTITISTGGT